MHKEKLNENHELDLELVKQDGGISNNEEPLVNKEFLNEEKAAKCVEASSNLFLNSQFIEELGFKKK